MIYAYWILEYLIFLSICSSLLLIFIGLFLFLLLLSVFIYSIFKPIVNYVFYKYSLRIRDLPFPFLNYIF